MGLFDFLKSKPIDYYNVGIVFKPNNLDISVLSKCRVGDKVNLWTKSNRSDIRIYAPDRYFKRDKFGGVSNIIGVIPDKYFRVIKGHLISNKGYEATIAEISGYDGSIKIKLSNTD